MPCSKESALTVCLTCNLFFNPFSLSLNVLKRPLADNEILAFSKIKAFADDKLNVIQNIKFVSLRVENVLGKREECWLPRFFSFSRKIFRRLSPQGHQKASICVYSLPNNKILDRSKFKAIADDKLNVVQMMRFICN